MGNENLKERQRMFGVLVKLLHDKFDPSTEPLIDHIGFDEGNVRDLLKYMLDLEPGDDVLLDNFLLTGSKPWQMVYLDHLGLNNGVPLEQAIQRITVFFV